MSEIQFTSEELAKEEWRLIPGCDAYQVSDLGRVRSRKRRGPSWTSLAKDWMIVKPRPSNGYQNARVFGRVATGIHCLVLSAFVGPCPDGLEACHWDGNKANNRLSNLRWDTRPNNHADKKRHRTNGQGQNNGMAKITDADALSIRQRYAIVRNFCAVAREFGVSDGCIRKVVYGRSFGHLPGAISSVKDAARSQL